jgi:ubiquitin-protein ligase
VALLGDEEDPETVLYWLKDFSQQCSAFMKRHQDNGWSKEDEGDVMFATRVTEVADKAIKMSKRCLTKSEEELVMIDFSTRYQSALGPLRFDTVDSMPNHYFLNKVPNAPSTLNMRQVFKELTAYRTALPVEYGSSCFCRVINDRLDLLRVMITGPDETPYANGCFFFDVNLTGYYPSNAPAVQFLTTGGGNYRFNPNLYNCGKVCLSLLGTWQGPGWVSGQSTLLQVLISIQSLIFVPDPFFNEPGYAYMMNTPQGDSQSKQYNRTIRQYTLSAAIESHLSSMLNMTNPYPEFESVMKKHFLEKRFLIENELRNWANEDTSLNSRVTNICNLLSQLASKESKKTISRSKRRSEPIALDGGDDSNQKKSKKNDIIEIDYDKKPSAKSSSNDIIDLT